MRASCQQFRNCRRIVLWFVLLCCLRKNLANSQHLLAFCQTVALFSLGLCTSITFDKQTIHIAFTGCKCRADARNFAIFIVLSSHSHCLVAFWRIWWIYLCRHLPHSLLANRTSLYCLIYHCLVACWWIWWTCHVFQIHQICHTRHLQWGPSCLFIIIIVLYCLKNLVN